jgi:hypothetical protein
MFGKTRIIILLAVLVFRCISLNGQEYTKAIGVRGAFGYDHYQYAGAEFSFQKDVKKIGRAEYDFGWYASSQWDVLKFTGIRQWKIVNKTKFHFYGGVGGGAGYVMFPYSSHWTGGRNGQSSTTLAHSLDMTLDWLSGLPSRDSLAAVI